MSASKVTVRIDGVTHAGVFDIHNGVLTVRSSCGWKTSLAGELPPLAVARTLLRDIVQLNQSRRDLEAGVDAVLP